LLHLGRLDLSAEEQKTLSLIIDRQVKGHTRSVRFSDKLEQLAEQIYLKYIHTLDLVDKTGNDATEANSKLCLYRESMDFSHYRSVGAELLALHFWKSLNLDRILQECSFTEKEIELSKIAILGRLLSPGSERQTLHWFNEESSLSEFLRIIKPSLKKDALYRIADRILEQKQGIERRLRDNLKSLHSLADQVYLYDLTNTYFEGNKRQSLICKRGKSKEKRDDCPLVTLALVVDQNGFPVYSRIYSGSQSEPKTLKDILKEIFEDKEDLIERLVQPSVIMDRGIATKENIAYLQEKQYTYFVIERRDAVQDFKAEFHTLSGFEETIDNTNSKLYLKKVSLPNLSRVLVYSEAKALKERGMTSKREQHFLEEAEQLLGSHKKGYIKDRDKIQVRIGRLKEKYGSTASQYDFKVVTGPEQTGQVVLLELIDQGRKSSKSEFPGCYVIETNSCELNAKQIWSFYMKQSEVEAAFRCMKTELGTRPVHHKTDERIEAHLFYSVLAYAILKSITYKLSQQDCHISWTSIKRYLKSHMRSTMICTDDSGYRVHIRQTGLPEEKAAKIYKLLNMTIYKNQITTKHRV
jgi:transposase